jgi:hypothetical protein
VLIRKRHGSPADTPVVTGGSGMMVCFCNANKLMCAVFVRNNIYGTAYSGRRMAHIFALACLQWKTICLPIDILLLTVNPATYNIYTGR